MIDRRAAQYAVCTFALDYDRVTDGAEGVFDQALTNGLAAIVAHEWAGEERGRRGTRSASELLSVIEAHGKVTDDGTVRILRHGEPEWLESSFDGDPLPNFTTVDVPTLREAIRATQAIRHARESGGEATTLSMKHLDALRELDDHPALFALSDEVIVRAEQGLAAVKEAEVHRATDYWAGLGGEERARRAAIDYGGQYAWETQDARCVVEACPVCWTEAFVASAFDSYLDEIGVGTCIACSYSPSREVADDEAVDLQLRRQIAGED